MEASDVEQRRWWHGNRLADHWADVVAERNRVDAAFEEEGRSMVCRLSKYGEDDIVTETS